MKNIRWTAYALAKLLRREICREDVEQTLKEPDTVVPGRSPRRIYQRVYVDTLLEMTMLLRVVVEENEDELLVVTLYKTSKIDRYQKGILDED